MRILFLLFLSLLGQAFTTQGTFSPIKTLPTSYIDESVFSYCSYNSKNNNVFMTWIDNDDYPWFTIYSPNSGVFDTYPSKIVDQKISLNPPISCYNRKVE